ncbi:MlaD family protein [Nocardia sp. NPDC004123]
MHQDFIRGTDRTQRRALSLAAAVVVTVTVMLAVLGIVVHRLDRDDGLVVMRIDTPYVAPGISSGTHVMLHGVPVGTITALDRIDGERVRLTVALQSSRISGLTDAFDIDYRPENYFGVTAVNLIGGTGGRQLTTGLLLRRNPLGDYSMSTMIERGSLVVDGTLTQEMMTTLDKVVRYTDGLNPMIRTGIVLADRIAKTQRALPSSSLSAFNDVADVLPVFLRETTAGLYGVYDLDYHHLPDGSLGTNDPLLDHASAGLGLASGSLFGAAGKLLASHGDELTPVVKAVQEITDTIPGVLANGSLAGKLQTLVDQYDRAFSGAGATRTLQLRVVLDRLPALAAPLGMLPAAPGAGR